MRGRKKGGRVPIRRWNKNRWVRFRPFTGSNAGNPRKWHEWLSRSARFTERERPDRLVSSREGRPFCSATPSGLRVLLIFQTQGSKDLGLGPATPLGLRGAWFGFGGSGGTGREWGTAKTRRRKVWIKEDWIGGMDEARRCGGPAVSRGRLTLPLDL